MAGRAEKTLAEGLAAMGMDFPEVPLYIKNNLSPRFQIREYQEEAFQYSIYYIEHMAGGRQIHLLYHMATGSGKTYIMAGMILYYYKHGYRNFLFFVDQKPIVEKTKENFINKTFGKYLFPEKIVILYLVNDLVATGHKTYPGTLLSLSPTLQASPTASKATSI